MGNKRKSEKKDSVILTTEESINLLTEAGERIALETSPQTVPQSLPEEEKSKSKHIKLDKHAVGSMFLTSSQLELFDQAEELAEKFRKDFGLNPLNKIEKLGIDLTDLQYKVMEGILREFTETDYKGNKEPRDKENHLEETYRFGKFPSSYQNIKTIPVITISKRKLMRNSGIDPEGGQSQFDRLEEAVKVLGTRQICCVYSRLKYDEKGKPVIKKNGKPDKEEVTSVDTLFHIKELRNLETKIFTGYEILPSAIFLDQIENYFLLIPYDWREELVSLLGKKEASPYLFKFILYLMDKFDTIRRDFETKGIPESKRPYKLNYAWITYAKAIGMPYSYYHRNKKRAYEHLHRLYSSALKSGYLTGFEIGNTDTLHFNPEKFYNKAKNRAEIEAL